MSVHYEAKKGFKCQECNGYIIPPQRYNRDIPLCRCMETASQEISERPLKVRTQHESLDAVIARLVRIDEARNEEIVEPVLIPVKKKKKSIRSILGQVIWMFSPKQYLP